jgi:hypothetical protein
MQTRDAVRSRAAASHSGQKPGRVLLAADFDELARCNFERGENCRALPADILSDGPFTLLDFTFLSKSFY